ncbi:MAG: DNRLRE domain-containing protein [Bacteroidetes bacterium]|jgi:hypothetical protein|nr:DNRLRE domain-containing protein [Bacteroidota bacterium]MBT6687594.1 DNRLRE domain-containing protein [Bacteroidota bacterium]MBT7143593.1 DNRLRE domain-containing protein [Bacteroidota bacterium]MBT7492189.1 DNRLRE domain-containing protein [Bacteroidota bacterium]
MKAKRIWIIVFFVLSIFGIGKNANSQTVLTLQPNAIAGKDATIWYLSNQNLANFGPTNTTNYGNSTDFVAAAWNWRRFPGSIASLVQFNLSSIPLGTTIDSAFLFLYHDVNSIQGTHFNLSGSNAGLVQRIIQPWNELVVTWDNAPNYSVQNQVVLLQSTSPTQNYENIVVTSLVQDMLDNPTEGFGFRISMQIASAYRKLVFASSDNLDASVHPKLVVYYSNCLAPTVNIGDDTLICGIDTLQLDAGNSGASSFLWSTGETTQAITVNPMFTTEYFVTVVDNACSSYDSIMVEVNSSPVSNLIEDTTICSGDSVILIVGDANASYYWSTDEYVDSIAVSNSGIYYVSISNGCGFITDSVNVDVIITPNLYLTNEINICFGDSVILEAGNPGSEYLWSTGETTENIEVNSSGVYSLVVSNECGIVVDSVSVLSIATPYVNLGNDTIICAGESVLLNAQNQGMNFFWSNGDSTQSILAIPNLPTIYSVLIDNFGCLATDSILIAPQPSPTVFLGEDTTVCEKDSIFLDAGNPESTFFLSDSSTNQTATFMPDFSMTVFVNVSSFGCTETDTFEINIFPISQINLGNDTVLCDGNVFELDAGNSGNEYLWSTGETTEQIIITNSGFYTVNSTNQCEDVAGDTIIVNFAQQSEVNLGNDTTICFSQVYTVDAGTGYISYLWSNGETNQTISLDSSLLNYGANYFSVLVADTNYCYSTDSIFIYMIDKQAINMQSGWNIISTYMVPFQPNIDSVMNYLASEIILVKNSYGMTYWPLYALNSIGDMVIGEGYQVKVNSPQTLIVYGNAVLPELSPITFPQGWSFIGYLRQTQASIETMLAPIENEIVLVKNGNGFVYWPLYNLNAIVNMVPGEGYQIKLVNNVILTYPAN